MLHKLPEINSIKILESISFSTYNRLSNCILHGLPKGNIVFSVEPKWRVEVPGVDIIFGKLFHTLMQSLESIQSMDKDNSSTTLSKILHSKLEIITRNIYGNDNDRIKSLKLSKQVNDIYLTAWKGYLSCKENRGSYYREKKLYSNNNLLFGMVDELYIEDDFINIVDYKTTYKVEKLLIQRNIDQLHFYSYLVNENYGKFPNKLYLKGLLDLSESIKLDVDYANKLAASMLKLLSIVNHKINTCTNIVDLCSPDADYCKYCKYDVFCPATIIKNNE